MEYIGLILASFIALYFSNTYLYIVLGFIILLYLLKFSNHRKLKYVERIEERNKPPKEIGFFFIESVWMTTGLHYIIPKKYDFKILPHLDPKYIEFYHLMSLNLFGIYFPLFPIQRHWLYFNYSDPDPKSENLYVIFDNHYLHKDFNIYYPASFFRLLPLYSSWGWLIFIVTVFVIISSE